MQYILTEQEYNDLKNTKTNIIKMEKDKLQELCTKISDTMPAGVDWIGKDEPWGCIKSKDYEWYCDECPVRSICPEPYKEVSK